MADLVTRTTTYAPSTIIICEKERAAGGGGEGEGERAKAETKNETTDISRNTSSRAQMGSYARTSDDYPINRSRRRKLIRSV